MQHTKEAIIECTLKFAEQKPINKITVKDIVDSLGITRNTFYYHFHDIYHVLTCYVDEQMNSIISNKDVDPETAIFKFFDLSARYKKVWLNIYKSLGHERTSFYMTNKIHDMMIMTISSKFDIDLISDIDLEIICAFYEEALFGIFIRWMKSGKFQDEESVKESLERIKVLFDGQIELLIEKSLNN